MKVMIPGRYRYADSTDMLKLLGVRTLPVDGMPERLIHGVRVYVKPKPTVIGGGMKGLRVMAICECGQHVPVGRLIQHKCKVTS